MVQLDQRVTFYERVKDRQPTGEVISSYDEVFSTWADVNVISGEERYDGDGKLVYKKYSCKIRKRDIDEQMVVKFKDKVYDISNVEPMFSEQRERFIFIEMNYITDKEYEV